VGPNGLPAAVASSSATAVTAAAISAWRSGTIRAAACSAMTGASSTEPLT
jgi:hypothetical protein